MKKPNLWGSQAFCFRMSLLLVLIWFIFVSIMSLIIHFSTYHRYHYTSVFEFSTWLFFLPAIAIFCFVNSMPRILAWLLEPFKREAAEKIFKDPGITEKVFKEVKTEIKGFTTKTREPPPPRSGPRSQSYKQLKIQLERKSSPLE